MTRLSANNNNLVSLTEVIKTAPPPRRPSLGTLLRRSKSNEPKPKKKSQAIIRGLELERQRQEAALQQQPPLLQPTLPLLYEDQKPISLAYNDDDSFSSATFVSSVAFPSTISGESDRLAVNSISFALPSPEGFDSCSRSGSVMHRGRNSYANNAFGGANKRLVRKKRGPTPFNILIIGAQSSGKTSFVNFFKKSLKSSKETSHLTTLQDDMFASPHPKFGNFERHYVETNIDGENVGVTLWDSEGLEKHVIDFQLREIMSFLESKFEETFAEEKKVDRDITKWNAALKMEKWPGERQSKYIQGIAGGLDEDLDLKVLRMLQGKTTVIPIISKADMITTAQMIHLKKKMLEGMRLANLDPLQALGLSSAKSSSGSPSDTDNEDNQYGTENGSDSGTLAEDGFLPMNKPLTLNLKRNLSHSSHRQVSIDGSDIFGDFPHLPLSVISPDMYEPSFVGRRFPWGFADPMNSQHCDFVQLKESILGEWRDEIREVCRDVCYENWRTRQLKHHRSQS
ncbi:septin [Blumeria hordei DH14]|uniref:Septin n=1 Tax=Blumeria graminis f. sp. hordei (strain DH14) TaxID=546991 RepID=N1JDH0_BLUG1|nr:septin [Blumeria hordei DH14]